MNGVNRTTTYKQAVSADVFEVGLGQAAVVGVTGVGDRDDLVDGGLAW